MSPHASPGLERIEGRLLGVEPGPDAPSIALEARGQRLTLPVTAELAERAGELRDRRVEAMLLTGPSPRVLWLRDAAAPHALPGPAARTAAMLRAWATTLEILAR